MQVKQCSLADYGAIPDGQTRATACLQQAIDEVAAAGGGRVTVGGGRYLIGTVFLKSGVELHLEVDGVLLASPDEADYPLLESAFWKPEYAPRRNRRCLIYAEQAEDIAITGRGQIDCQGLTFCKPAENPRLWRYQRKSDTAQPGRMIFMAGCKRLLFTDFTLKDAAAGWGFWILDCGDVRFDRVTVDSDLDIPNSDGIHLNCSRDVTISNCRISCGDDALIVRAYTRVLSRPVPCERVTVTNCHLVSHCSAIRLGWADDYICRDCVFSNLTITDSRWGINMTLPHDPNKRFSDQGDDDTLIEHILFDNIVIDRHHAEPIRIEIDEGARVEAIRDISFSNMRVVSATPPRLLGRPDKKLQDITLSNVSFTIRPPADGSALPAVRSREAPFFGHIDNLVLDRVRIDLD
jgi:polygalacturonase